MINIIVLNGPPGSGKDTAAEFFLRHHPNAVHIKFADPLENAIAALLGNVTGPLFRRLRSHPHAKNVTPVIEGRPETTARTLMIDISETYAKPRFGSDIFGKIAADEIRQTLRLHSNADNHDWLFVVSDCGFQTEFNAFCQQLEDTEAKIHLIRLHRTGHSFANDSRAYICANEYCPSTTGIINDGSINELHKQLMQFTFQQNIQLWNLPQDGDPCYASNEEGPYQTSLEDIVQEILEDTDHEQGEEVEIWEGETKYYRHADFIRFDADAITERMAELASYEVGEWIDPDYPMLTSEQQTSLEACLKQAATDWFNQHITQPNFWRVENTRKTTITL